MYEYGQAYPLGHILVQDRDATGGKIMEKEREGDCTPNKTTANQRITSSPDRVSAIVDVCGKGEEPATVWSAFVSGVLFERLSLELRDRFDQQTDDISS